MCKAHPSNVHTLQNLTNILNTFVFKPLKHIFSSNCNEDSFLIARPISLCAVLPKIPLGAKGMAIH